MLVYFSLLFFHNLNVKLLLHTILVSKHSGQFRTNFHQLDQSHKFKKQRNFNFHVFISLLYLGQINCSRQFIGTPIVLNPDPFMVNLFLYCYERECFLQEEKWDLQMVWIFSSIFRFIDDPCNFSNVCILMSYKVKTLVKLCFWTF